MKFFTLWVNARARCRDVHAAGRPSIPTLAKKITSELAEVRRMPRDSLLCKLGWCIGFVGIISILAFWPYVCNYSVLVEPDS